MSAEAVALEHYRRRRRLVEAVTAAVRRAWDRVDLADLDRSWAKVADQLLVAVTGAQLAAAAVADGYLTEVLTQQGVAAGASAKVAPRLLAGVASDGRPLASLLQQSIVATRAALAKGVPPGRARTAGYLTLDMAAATQVADAGRAADQVAIVARAQVTGYVRMLVGKSCSRCAVLAGKRFRWNDGFQRHPKCDCIHIPAREDSADDLRTDPRRYFASLNRADQDRLFTKAGAEAIRSGADIGQVVNARAGMYTAGGRDFTTTGRGGARARLMPEQILREAGGDRDEAVRLLRFHGYLT